MHHLAGYPQFDRRELLAEAQRSAARGRHDRAIALYQAALATQSDHIEIVARLAPLLARVGRSFEAWRHFRGAGRALLAQRRGEWALAIFREAVRCLPHEFEAWRITAELEQKLGRPQVAFETLLDGRNQFRGGLQRDEAIALLELAREIEPFHTDVGVDLARLYARNGRVAEALDLLERLTDVATGRDLRRVRGAQWRLTWSPQHLWEWGVAACTGDPSRSGRGRFSRSGPLLRPILPR